MMSRQRERSPGWSQHSGNSTGGCSFEPESGLVMTSENHPVEVFDYGSEAFF